MNERVVYVLGAGFSAPPGIPVIANFLSKSKDLYFEDRTRFAHFAKVFDTIRELSMIKNHVSSDLSNIEEILSILEMQDHLGGRSLNDEFIRYITDVIKAYTPPIPAFSRQSNLANWPQVIFGNDIWRGYGALVTSLLRIWLLGHPHWQWHPHGNPKAAYDVISLNYDSILEDAVDHVSSIFQNETHALRLGAEAKSPDQSRFTSTVA